MRNDVNALCIHQTVRSLAKSEEKCDKRNKTFTQ